MFLRTKRNFWKRTRRTTATNSLVSWVSPFPRPALGAGVYFSYVPRYARAWACRLPSTPHLDSRLPPPYRCQPVMNIVKATRKYEGLAWPASPNRRDRSAVETRGMAESAFSFFRATFYRWVQLWEEVCRPICNDAPAHPLSGRSARGKLRHLARHRRTAGLGSQRFRRSLPLSLHHGFGEAGHQRAIGVSRRSGSR